MWMYTSSAAARCDGGSVGFGVAGRKWFSRAQVSQDLLHGHLFTGASWPSRVSVVPYTISTADFLLSSGGVMLTASSTQGR